VGEESCCNRSWSVAAAEEEEEKEDPSTGRYNRHSVEPGENPEILSTWSICSTALARWPALRLSAFLSLVRSQRARAPRNEDEEQVGSTPQVYTVF
jgi:hypothetical protein